MDQPTAGTQNSSNPVNPEKNKEKIWLIAVAVVVGVAIIAGAVYYFVFSGSSNPAPSVSLQPAVEWKTYENETYGFQIQYPGNWSEPEQRDYIIELGSAKFELEGELKYPISFRFLEPEDQQNVEKKVSFFASIMETTAEPSDGAEKLTIDNRPAIKYDDVGMVGYKNYVIFDEKNTIYYTLMSVGDENEANFDKIISTFKFVD